MIKCKVLVPLNYEECAEDLLIERFSGWTREGGDHYGAWKPHFLSTPVYDHCVSYMVAVPSWLDVPDFLHIVSEVQHQARQECIYFEVAGIPEIVDFRLLEEVNNVA